jgi:serine/threonine protein kinase/Tol biopolymer transport system component
MSQASWEEVERVIAAILELPEEQRPAYLARQPAPVRAEVESLLAAYRGAGSFLGGETGNPAAAEMLGKMKLAFAGTRLYSESAAETAAFAVNPGTQIGAYRIESVIGKGGMGVVYRALDTRLNRPVAVKFLFDGMADSTARRRFQREAQMASSLNHPHILTVHDAGDFEGHQYLVTEFVDGGTLRDWAGAEKRTWREIAGLLAGVADGLATAHAAGILHRDIKPDNILVARNGYAKLSDFGLAKLEEKVGPDEATHSLQGTRPGMILGTFAYMSPEQASGRATDARSDIFSFGIVLYELLAGNRPFGGATDKELLQTIIHGTAPPLSADVPYGLRMIVEKALENAPADRYQSTRDLVVDLRRLTRQSGESGPEISSPPVAAAAPIRKGWKVGALAALVILALLLSGGVVLWRLQHPAAQAPRPVVQFDIPPPPGTMYAPSIARQYFAISPDGKRLAFSATSSAGTNIWIRDLASLDVRPVPGTEGAWSIFWGRDSRSIYYSVKRTLKEANLETGSGRSVAELPFIPQLGTWRSNGDLLLYIGEGDIHELRIQDGSSRKGPVFEGMRWPLFLPGADRLIYTAFDKQQQQAHALAVDYPGGKPVFLTQSDSRVQYAPPLIPGEPGHLVFIRGGSLLAQPFDPDPARLLGEPSPIAQNVIYYRPNFAAAVSVSQNGVLVYHAGFPNAQLKWYDRNGKESGEVGRPSPYWGNVRISRDGRKVAATIWNDGAPGIWVYSVGGPESRRFTFFPEIHRRPVWSPDGTRLAFGRSQTMGPPLLATLDADGNGTPEEFAAESPADHTQGIPTDWSPDGRFIAFDDGVGEEQRVAWIATVATRTFRPFLKNNFPQWGTAFSPDGKRVAFVSMESGRPEVYVQAFESTPAPHVAGERRQVSREGAWLVRWRGDGRELFYIGLDNQMQAVPVQGPLEFGEPKALFLISGVSQYGTTRDFQFDVSVDGQRFIMPTTGSIPPPPFTVIENWQEKFRP